MNENTTSDFARGEHGPRPYWNPYLAGLLLGGALLANGSIVFMLCVFAGGYATAYFVRRQWHD